MTNPFVKHDPPATPGAVIDVTAILAQAAAGLSTAAAALPPGDPATLELSDMASRVRTLQAAVGRHERASGDAPHPRRRRRRRDSHSARRRWWRSLPRRRLALLVLLLALPAGVWAGTADCGGGSPPAELDSRQVDHRWSGALA